MTRALTTFKLSLAAAMMLAMAGIANAAGMPKNIVDTAAGAGSFKVLLSRRRMVRMSSTIRIFAL